MIDNTIIELKSDFVCEALDLAFVHASWTSRRLQDGDPRLALESFERCVTAVRHAAEEMKAIRAAVARDALTGEASVEHRAERVRRRANKSEAA